MSIPNICDQPLSIPSFHCISFHFEANQTMLKIWSEFMFGHSYLRYSLKLWPTTQRTFVPLHFIPFWGKSDNAENLVRIHVRPLVPLLFFKTVTNHSAYLHSTVFPSISRQLGEYWKFGWNSSLATCTSIILQNCGQPLSVPSFHCISFHFESNRTMLKIWSEFMFGHSYLCYSSKLWPTTQHTFIPLYFPPFRGNLENTENLVGIHLWPLVPPFILQNCGQPLSVPSFHCISFHFESNRTMLKIWSEFMFGHSYLCYSSKLSPTTQHTFVPLHFLPFRGNSDNAENLVGIHLRPLVPPLFLKTVTNHSAYLHSAAFPSISKANQTMLKIWSEFMFGHLYLRYSSKLWPTTQCTFIPLHFVYFEANWTMLKIWSEFLFGHSYLRYSWKLWPTTQHTFILLHFVPFRGKSDNAENLVGIHLRPLVPPLFLKTVTNHSAYLHSAAFPSISRQIRQCWKFGRNSCSATCTSVIPQNCHQPLSIPSFRCILFHFEANQTMLKIWSEFIFGHSYLHYSSKLWPTTQHTFILLHFLPFRGKLDNAENLVGIHVRPLVPPLFLKTVTNHSAYLRSAAFRSISRQVRQCGIFG